MSPYTFLCAHRLQRKHVHRYKRGVALSCDIPFKALLVRVLERIFSFFPSLSASSRELIQHSDFPPRPEGRGFSEDLDENGAGRKMRGTSNQRMEQVCADRHVFSPVRF